MPRIYLKIPYNKRGLAKSNGAKWDENYHKWYLDNVTTQVEVPDSLKYYTEGSLDADNVIHIGLYGGKSPLSNSHKFEPRLARIIQCDKIKECPLAKQGRCAAVTCTTSIGCPHATHRVIKQEQKDLQFKQRIEQLPKYNALRSISNPHFLVIPNNLAIIYTGFLGLQLDPEHQLNKSMCPPRRLKSDDDIAISLLGFQNKSVVLPLAKLTPDTLHEILTARPHNLGRYEITDYRLKTVPRILAEMSENWPDGYNAYAKAYPENAARRSNIGRTAYLHTCTQGATWIDNDKREWKLVDDKLICENFIEFIHAPNILKTPNGTYISIPISKDQKIEITDEDQINPNTIFA